jgi:DNA polymerase-3 subunit gamma/tau
MTELALYRKYRPQSFKDVLGQEHVVSVLSGALKQGNIAHAYLFSGSRGTGKTSVARIFARELGTDEKDLYEIDAASNRGIDDIRELREAVHVLPFSSKYKVYIIDEVHMLTKEAFNALLKTLEEPPPHALFILATTELDRLPETIISRCQTFLFRKPTIVILREMVTRIAKKEGFTLEPSSAELIALLADGSFRDAHGILQKIVTASADKKVSVEEVERVTGAPRGELLNQFLGALDERQITAGIGVLHTLALQNIDMKVFLKLALERIRTVLLLKYAPDLKKTLEAEYNEQDFKILEAFAVKKETGLNSLTLKRLLEASDDVGRAYAPELPLELALIALFDTEGVASTTVHK